MFFYGKLQVRISHEQLRHFSLTPPLLATFNLKHNTYIFMYKARQLDIGAKVVTKAEHASSRPGILRFPQIIHYPVCIALS